MRIQKFPNLVKSENRICLTRIRFEIGKVGTDSSKRGYSNKISISICFEPRDLWVGVYWNKKIYEFSLYLGLIPCFPIRIKWVWTYGGIYP